MSAVFGNSRRLLPETKPNGLCRKSEKTNPKPKCFGFGRRRKGANAVFGNSLWLLPETKLSGLCADVVVRAWGLEPQRIAAREPKSRMSANSIMPA